MREVKAGSKKEQTRARILRAAARAIRKHGYEGVGVAAVMREAGLTHGGFYAHFASRDALLAQAAEQAGVESVENLSRAVARAKPGEELMALVDSYLADRHAEAPEQGLGWRSPLRRDAAPNDEVTRRQPHQGPHRLSSASSPTGERTPRTRRPWRSSRAWSARCCLRARWAIRSFPKAFARPRASSSAARQADCFWTKI
jgi:AcrR family transcriptional regulator